MARVITLEQAKSRYVHRFTMEHIPEWASSPTTAGRYYAPQFRSDQEWYDGTDFPGERNVPPNATSCNSHSQTWPVGTWVTRPWTYLDSSAFKARPRRMKTPVQSAFIQPGLDNTWSVTVIWANGSRLHNTYFPTRDDAGRWLERLIANVDFLA